MLKLVKKQEVKQLIEVFQGNQDKEEQEADLVDTNTLALALH